MSDLPARLRKACAFDVDAVRDQAMHEDSDGYFGFISGAQWEYTRTKPLLEALVKGVSALEDYASLRGAPIHWPNRDAYTYLEDPAQQALARLEAELEKLK